MSQTIPVPGFARPRSNTRAVIRANPALPVLRIDLRALSLAAPTGTCTPARPFLRREQLPTSEPYGTV
ncbi:MAG: hypothetical protein KDG55_02080 [Rhodocyclaceae bacterium]|nr:hypothetical protein [Rhodocyclaceae bacterium]